MIYVYLKTSETIFKIKNTSNEPISNIIENLEKDQFIKIYNYVFPCNDIEHIEVID